MLDIALVSWYSEHAMRWDDGLLGCRQERKSNLCSGSVLSGLAENRSSYPILRLDLRAISSILWIRNQKCNSPTISSTE